MEKMNDITANMAFDNWQDKHKDAEDDNNARGKFIKIILDALPGYMPITEAADTARKIADSFMYNEPEIAIKNDRKDNKLMWELLPLDVIEEVVRVYTFGARKYSPNKWQNLEDGYNRYKAALLRHLTLIDQGQHFDPESGLLHASQVAWNAIALCYFEMKKHGKGDIDSKRE